MYTADKNEHVYKN